MSENTFSDRKEAKNQDCKNNINEEEFSRTLDSEDEGEIKAKYKTTLANMESRQTEKGEYYLIQWTR